MPFLEVFYCSIFKSTFLILIPGVDRTSDRKCFPSRRALLYLDVREDDHGQDHHEGHRPHGCAHHLGDAGVPPVGAADRMNHGQVAIDGHHRQAEDGRELVHGVRCHDDATQEGAEGPVGEHVLRGEEGQPDDVKFIGNSQVQDVDVGDRFQACVAQDHVDGQSVARQTHHEHGEVYDCRQHGAAALEGNTLRGLVREKRVGRQQGRRSGFIPVVGLWGYRGAPGLIQGLHLSIARSFGAFRGLGGKAYLTRALMLSMTRTFDLTKLLLKRARKSRVRFILVVFFYTQHACLRTDRLFTRNGYGATFICIVLLRTSVISLHFNQFIRLFGIK